MTNKQYLENKLKDYEFRIKKELMKKQIIIAKSEVIIEEITKQRDSIENQLVKEEKE